MLRITAGFFTMAMLATAASDTRLADAVQRGDSETVRVLLKQKVDVNGAQGDGMTALHWAASRDDLATARLLLAVGASVKAETRMGGVTPLFMAAKNGSAPMIDQLLKAGADANRGDSTGVTPLMLVAASGSTDAIKVLLRYGVNANAIENAHGQTALVFAAAYNRDAAVRLLIASGANPETITRVLDPGCGSVFNRSECDETDQYGNPIPKKDTPKEAPAKEASAKEASTKEAPAKEAPAKEAPAKEASAKEASTKEASTKEAPAKEASAKEASTKEVPAKEVPAKEASTKEASTKEASTKEASSKESLTPSESENAKKDKENSQRRRSGAKVTGGMTALLFAARDGQMGAAHALIESGADVNNAGMGEKMTPLVMAIANGHYDLAKYFLDHGADPNKASAVGLTPLYATLDMEWAPYSWLPQPITYRESINYLDLMKALLSKGADPNARLGAKVWFRSLSGDHGWVDPAGATPFWRAAQATDLAAMHLLVEAGADPKIASNNDTTPLMVATGVGWAANFARNAPDSWTKAVQYCLDLGIDINAKDKNDYTGMHGAAFRGDTELVAFLAKNGAKVDVVTKDGFSPADMANGPIEHSEQHPETVDLLLKLGSPFANNCRSTNCFITDGKERKRLGGS